MQPWHPVEWEDIQPLRPLHSSFSALLRRCEKRLDRGRIESRTRRYRVPSVEFGAKATARNFPLDAKHQLVDIDLGIVALDHG